MLRLCVLVRHTDLMLQLSLHSLPAKPVLVLVARPTPALPPARPCGGVASNYSGGFVKIPGQWVGLAATFSVEMLLNTLGPVGGFGSEIVGVYFGKYFWASGEGSQRFVYGRSP